VTVLRAQIALSLGLLVTMALRAPARRLIGPRLAYRLWTLGPAAALTSLFPTLAEFMSQEVLLRPGASSGMVRASLQAVTDGSFWAVHACPL
jgi:beta-lactamase regulating signal transducer with metallopeptidase domain